MEYTKDQSTVIALWVLALQTRSNPLAPIQGATAPEIIARLGNNLGGEHTSDSMLLHTHGYNRLFQDRQIDREATNLQKEIAKELREQGVTS